MYTSVYYDQKETNGGANMKSATQLLALGARIPQDIIECKIAWNQCEDATYPTLRAFIQMGLDEGFSARRAEVENRDAIISQLTNEKTHLQNEVQQKNQQNINEQITHGMIFLK